MRKRVAERPVRDEQTGGWLDLERLASAELTSEDPAHPLEAALDGSGRGWRSGQPGAQAIRLVFDQPQELRRIRLEFEEREAPRTQEFVLCWATSTDAAPSEVVRQQYTFSPPHTTREVETYEVDLRNVRVLDLAITPALGGGGAVASLARLALASSV